MVWRLSLLPGSFKGAAFQVDSHSHTGGRRGHLHEYPLRDDPWFEDLGRRTREFSIDVFIVGEAYNLERDALIAACEQPGAGTLVHPYLGTKQVVCTGFSVSERIDEGRMCRFSLTFVEAGTQQFPGSVTDFYFQADSMAALTEAAALADFVSAYQSDGLPSFVFDGVFGVVDSFTSIMTGFGGGDGMLTAINGLLSNIENLMRSPTDFGTQVVDVVKAYRTDTQGTLRDSAGAKIAQPNLAKLSALDVSNQVAVIPQTTSTRVTQAANMNALASLVRQAALASEARTVPGLTFDSYDAANAYSRDFVSRVDTEILSAGSEAAYLPLNNMMAAVVTDLSARAGKLPQNRTITLQEARPSLALAYSLYGDASRADDVARRNGVRHPAFMPQGTPLKVLTA